MILLSEGVASYGVLLHLQRCHALKSLQFCTHFVILLSEGVAFYGVAAETCLNSKSTLVEDDRLLASCNVESTGLLITEKSEDFLCTAESAALLYTEESEDSVYTV